MQSVGLAVAPPIFSIGVLTGDAKHALLPACQLFLCLQNSGRTIGECKGAHSVVVLAAGFLATGVYSSPDLHPATLNVLPAQSDQLARTKASHNAKPVRIDIRILDQFAVQDRSVHLKKCTQILRLQYFFFLGACTLWHMQFFRPQSGHFAQAQPFAEHGQIRAHVGKVFFAQSSCKSFVDDGLQLLFRQVSHTPPANASTSIRVLLMPSSSHASAFALASRWPVRPGFELVKDLRTPFFWTLICQRC